MLATNLEKILQENPEYAAITPVIEKEILHHDLMDVLVKQGAMQRLIFIGGTSLRMCFNSSRLSEDLDFNAGYDFKPSDFSGLEVEIQNYLQKKYEFPVWVNKPNEDKQGNTSSWKISIVKESGRPDLPYQKMHLDVCAIPSFDLEKKSLINHYSILVPTEGLLIPVQSLNEALVDKLIALAYRSRRIKPRDLWDLVWIKQRGIKVNKELLEKKLEARGKSFSDFTSVVQQQLHKLLTDSLVETDFNQEMSRFIPRAIKQRTLEQPEYWAYLQGEVKQLVGDALNSAQPNKFDMS